MYRCLCCLSVQNLIEMQEGKALLSVFLIFCCCCCYSCIWLYFRLAAVAQFIAFYACVLYSGMETKGNKMPNVNTSVPFNVCRKKSVFLCFRNPNGLLFYSRIRYTIYNRGDFFGFYLILLHLLENIQSKKKQQEDWFLHILWAMCLYGCTCLYYEY